MDYSIIRKHLVRCYVLSIFLYASESWTLNKQIMNAFEMWIFLHTFRISHLDRKTNVEVLEMAKVKQTLLRTLQEKTTIFWTLDMKNSKTKTTDGRKDKRDKTQRKAKKDLDK